MSRDVRVAAISGSRREASYTAIAIETALLASEELGASTEHIDLRSLELPVFDPDEQATRDVGHVQTSLQRADAILLGTPVYHGSYSGVLKNAIDHCGFEEFEDKTVGLLAVAGGRFPISAMDHLRTVCRALNAWVLPTDVAIPQANAVIEHAEIVDETIAQRVERLGRLAVRYAAIEPHQHTFESEHNVGAGVH